jgi:ABC-2 type transport system permease protein
MKGPLFLLAHSFRRMRTLLIVMALLLCAFQVFLILIASSIHETAESSHRIANIAEMLPSFVRNFMGPSLLSFISFGGIVSQGYFHPAVQGALIGLTIAIATMPVSEIESGFMDLILSRPLARHWIITRSILMMVLCTAALLAMMLAATWLALHAFAPKGVPWPEAKVLLSLAANLSLLLLAWGGVALAIGAVSRRRGVAGTATGLLALTTFLLEFAPPTWRPAGWFAWLSPFQYYKAMKLIIGVPLRTHDLWVLAGIALTGYALAYVLFARRDLSR